MIRLKIRKSSPKTKRTAPTATNEMVAAGSVNEILYPCQGRGGFVLVVTPLRKDVGNGGFVLVVTPLLELPVTVCGRIVSCFAA